MKILVFGGAGMLGHKLVQRLGVNFDVWCTVRERFESIARFGLFSKDQTLEVIDVTEPASIKKAIQTVNPDVVVNAVGIIKQLPIAGDVINTLTVNSILPHRLAELSEEFGFRLVCFSTDCVFSGEKGNYRESDTANAHDLYGKSKNLGEVNAPRCLTIRTSIVGRELRGAHSLVEWFLSNRGGRVKGFANAIYSGFPTVIIADIIKSLIIDHRDLSGLYHISSDPINKFDLLRLVGSAYAANIEIDRDEDFRIDRSLDSTKFRAATGFVPKPWPEMVELMRADPTPYDIWRR